MPDIHGTFPTPTEEERVSMQPRIDAFIFPRIPETENELSAYALAVDQQINHDKTIAAQLENTPVPPGTTGFKIGDFSMSFESGAFDSAITRKTICQTAYGLLLKAGLLYKGVC